MERFFVNRPIFAIVISIVIVIIGLLSIRTLPVEQYPDITPPVVEVSASYQGADAVTVDQSVATPIAQSIMGVKDMLYMQTTSSNDGQMSLQVTFDVGSNPDLNTIFTQNNVNSSIAMLPSSVKTQGVVTQQAMSGFLMVYALHSDGRYDDNFLSNYAFINIQNELLKINGVGKVEVMGAGEYSMRIWVKPDLLSYYNISVEDITAAIEAQSSIFPAGKLSAEPNNSSVSFTYTVTTPAQINSAEQYGEIVVRALDDGSQLKLKEVADIELGSQQYGVTSNFGDKPCAIIVVYQSPGSNAVDVGSKVQSTMAQLSNDFIDGIDYTEIIDSTSSIKAGVKEIFSTLIFALLLVILIIYLFIQDVRATFIPLIAIPVSLIGAFMLFPLLGFSINIISLLGLVLAIGLVVDDAIVVVEAVQVNIESGMPPRKATLEAMHAVAPPIIATTVVLLAVFIPVSLSSGITGKMYQQFSITIAAAIAISALNALTLSPALCAMLLKSRQPTTKGFFGKFNQWFNRRVDGYMSFSRILTRHAIRSLILIGIISGATYLLIKTLPNGFLPEEDQGYIMVSASLPDAASVDRTQGVVKQIEQIIMSHPQVKSIASAAGYNLLAGIASTNSAAMFVQLVDYSKRKITAMELADMLNEELYVEINDAVAFAFGPPSIPGLGVASGVTFMVQERGGDNLNQLSDQTNMLLDSLRKNPAIASVSSQFNAGIPQRKLIINRDYAMREGVSIDKLHSLISTYLGGSYINNFNRFGKLYQTYIQADASYRQTSDDLNSYFVANGNGEDVPVSSFATIKDTVGVEYVSQFNLFRSIAINATPKKGYSSQQCMDEIEQTAQRVLPDNMGIAWSGMSYQEAKASSNQSSIYLIAIVFVFLALAALYNSWVLPLSILLGVPFAIFGSMLFIWLAHMLSPIYIDNLFMQISLIMLIGLSAKNAILIIEYANILYFEQGKSLVESAIGAAKLRVRPIIMTAFAFIIGIMPLVFASGAYSVARNVIGLSLVGGMTIATLLGLFVYPMLYVMVGKFANFENKRKRQLELQNDEK